MKLLTLCVVCGFLFTSSIIPQTSSAAVIQKDQSTNAVSNTADSDNEIKNILKLLDSIFGQDFRNFLKDLEEILEAFIGDDDDKPVSTSQAQAAQAATASVNPLLSSQAGAQNLMQVPSSQAATSSINPQPISQAAVQNTKPESGLRPATAITNPQSTAPNMIPGSSSQTATANANPAAANMSPVSSSQTATANANAAAANMSTVSSSQTATANANPAAANTKPPLMPSNEKPNLMPTKTEMVNGMKPPMMMAQQNMKNMAGMNNSSMINNENKAPMANAAAAMGAKTPGAKV